MPHRRPTRPLPAALATALAAALVAGSVPGALAGPATRSWPYWGRVTREQVGRPTSVARGVVLRSYSLTAAAGSAHAALLFVNLADPNVHLAVVAAHNRVAAGGETLSSMANRSHAVAGVNGDFFRIWSDASPINEEIIDGQLLASQRPTGPGYTVLRIGPGNRLTMDEASFAGTVQVGAASTALLGVNTVDSQLTPGPVPRYVAPTSGPIVLTSALGRAVRFRDGIAAHLVPDGSAWRVVHLAPVGLVAPPQGTDRLLVGSGPAGHWLSGHLRLGSVVRLGWRVGGPPGVRDALGGGQLLVRDGRSVIPAGNRDPPEAKTALALTRDGRGALFVWFYGGRHGGGLTRYQLSSWLLAHGAWQAMMFDDGGSSELVARPAHRGLRVLGPPSDGRERPIADGLFVVPS
ncbi:MAG: phosphodiester glycosidase family protein [Mycobacteriales bacterium]